MLGFDFAKKSSIGVLLISLAMSAATIGIYFVGALNDLENITVDLRTQGRHLIRLNWGTVPVSHEVVLAGIDDAAITPSYSVYSDRWGQGRWLTRKNWYDAYFYLLNFYEPKVIAYDISFARSRSLGQKQSEEDSKELEGFAKEAGLSWGQLLNDDKFPSDKLFRILDEAQAHKFAAQIESVQDSEGPPIIMGTFLTRNANTGSFTWDKDPEAEHKLTWLNLYSLPESCIRNIPIHFSYADNAELPTKEFGEIPQPAILGNIAVPRDRDSKVRRVPLIDGYRGIHQEDHPRFFPSLSLQSCIRYLGIVPGDPTGKTGISVDFGNEIHLWNEHRDLHVPIDRFGNMILNFESKIADYDRAHYIDIYPPDKMFTNPQDHADEIHPNPGLIKTIAGKIMVIGTTFTGAGDIGGCSIDDNMPFVFIHLTAIDNILRGSHLLPLEPLPAIFLLAICPLLVGLFALQPSARISTVGVISLFCCIELVAIILFHFNIRILPMIVPAVSILGTFGFTSIYVYQVERKGRLEIRKRFSAMVSPRVLQYMEEHPESLIGERRDASMFFSDVAGFTSISESLAPEKLSQILNDYLTPMTNIILARDGYVNKYAGDGIMAVWGVPYHSTDHAMQSCLAALEQQNKIRELIPFFEKEYNVKLHVRMGINTGSVSAGNMGSKGGDGSPERYEYTVMGDAVNFAARLEPSNKDYHTLIMIGVNTYEQAKDAIVARKLDKLGVYGKKEAVLVYELVGVKGKVSETMLKLIQAFEEGLDLYWQRNFVEALKKFEFALQLDSNDYPSKVFVERVKEFIVTPPSPEWNGEYVRKSK
jgi:class 3 adenylate cyclase/CHASE2 domain-containing sensor protein